MSTNVESIRLPNDTRGMTRELLWLALPIIGMMVSRMLMGFVDFVMVSQLGTEAQAAVSPASLFVFVVGCLGLGVANAVQTFVAQADGRGNPHVAGAYAWQSCYIALVFALITLPVTQFIDVWFGWIARVGHHSDALAQLEMDYMRIGLWSVAPSIVCMGFNGLFNGIRKPGVTLVATVISLAANVFGNWLLIFGHWGCPALGIAGAAYATVIAWSIRAAVLIGAALLPRFHHAYHTRWSFAYSASMMRGLIRVGGPTSLGWLVDIGSWEVFLMLIVPPFGVSALAASNVGFQYIHLSFMPAMGIGIALCSQVGFVIGEGRPKEAYRRARVALRVTAVYMSLAGLAFLLAGGPLIRLFNQDPAVIEAGRLILIWAAVFQIFDAMVITHMNALRGAGDTRWPAVLMASLCGLIFVGGGYAIARGMPQWGVSGPWAMCALYVIALGIALTWRWLAGGWESIRLFDQAHRPPLAVEPPDEAPIATAAATMETDVEALAANEP